jgi:hypothetical protein
VGAEATEDAGPEGDARGIEPGGIDLELLEEAAKRRRRVGDRVDAAGEGAIDELAPFGLSARGVDLVDERFGDRVRVVIGLRVATDDGVRELRVDAEERAEGPAEALCVAGAEVVPVAELARDAGFRRRRGRRDLRNPSASDVRRGR